MSAIKKRKLFCELSPACYHISLRKEYLLRDIHDRFSGEIFARTRNTVPFSAVVKSHSSNALRRLEGVDMELQRNKLVNLRLASAQINWLVVQPGETFSFWKLVGEPSAKRGYLDGLVISAGKIGRGVGGGLCQLAHLLKPLPYTLP